MKYFRKHYSRKLKKPNSQKKKNIPKHPQNLKQTPEVSRSCFQELFYSHFATLLTVIAFCFEIVGNCAMENPGWKGKFLGLGSNSVQKDKLWSCGWGCKGKGKTTGRSLELSGRSLSRRSRCREEGLTNEKDNYPWEQRGTRRISCKGESKPWPAWKRHSENCVFLLHLTQFLQDSLFYKRRGSSFYSNKTWLFQI